VAALVVLALATLASLGYAGAKKLGVLQYNYQYCTTPSQYQYCSTSTSTTTTTTPTSTSTSTTTTTTPTTTSTSTSTTTTTTPTTTSTSTSTSTSTTTPTSTKPGKGCGDKNHLHDRKAECKVTIFDVSKKEGKAGTLTSFTFTVTLSAQAIDPVTVSYKTADGTAKTGQFITNPDYVPTNGTLTFPVGSSSKTITVSVIGDKIKEPNESFFVNLSNLSPNAYFGDSQAVGTIQNDD
jgi:Calx-beta domain